MFHIVTRDNRERYARQIKDMHAHRPEMFDGRPGGGPEAVAGRLGRDRFDDGHAIYVMGIDSWGEIECCVRLRPASEGSIIGSYYRRGIGSGELAPEGPTTWEMSHYYARNGARGEAGHRLRAQMRLAVIATAVEAGVTRIVSVAETAYWPPIQRCGWKARRLGRPFAYCDGGEAVVYEIAVSAEERDAFKAWLDRHDDADAVAVEAGQVAAVAHRLGPAGLDLVSSLTRRIAGVEETDGAEAALALAEQLSRAADVGRGSDS